MNFAANKISWFRYVPEAFGNREKPEAEQVSLEIRRLTMSEFLARYESETKGDYRSWLLQEMKRRNLDKVDLLEDAEREFVEALPLCSDAVLKEFQCWCRHVRHFKNVSIGGETVTDPWLLYFPMYSAVCPDLGYSIAREICEAIGETARMSQEELENFAADCAGSPTQMRSSEERGETGNT